jgi:hypothetical protein
MDGKERKYCSKSVEFEEKNQVKQGISVACVDFFDKCFQYRVKFYFIQKKNFIVDCFFEKKTNFSFENSVEKIFFHEIKLEDSFKMLTGKLKFNVMNVGFSTLVLLLFSLGLLLFKKSFNETKLKVD